MTEINSTRICGEQDFEVSRAFLVNPESDCSQINCGRSVMRYTLSSILAALTICAFAGVTPAAATGSSGDANGMRAQAQSHPNEANQDPDYRAGFIAQGEVYPPGTLSGGHFVRSRSDYTALVPIASNCHMYQTSYGEWWFTECGPQ
jgi:hypothetical protein